MCMEMIVLVVIFMTKHVIQFNAVYHSHVFNMYHLDLSSYSAQLILVRRISSMWIVAFLGINRQKEECRRKNEVFESNLLHVLVSLPLSFQTWPSSLPCC